MYVYVLEIVKFLFWGPTNLRYCSCLVLIIFEEKSNIINNISMVPQGIIRDGFYFPLYICFIMIIKHLKMAREIQNAVASPLQGFLRCWTVGYRDWNNDPVTPFPRSPGPRLWALTRPAQENTALLTLDVGQERAQYV